MFGFDQVSTQVEQVVHSGMDTNETLGLSEDINVIKSEPFRFKINS